MTSFMHDKENKNGLSEYMNCYFVEKDIRKGYLFQYSDYDEDGDYCKISSKKLQMIRTYFPELIFISTPTGILITKTNYSMNEWNSDKKIGTILGYPYIDGFPYNYHQDIVYHFTIYVEDIYDKTYILFQFVGNNMNKINEIEGWIRKMNECIESDPEIQKIVKRIMFDCMERKPEKYYIDILTNNSNTSLTKEDWYNIRNQLFNIGMSELIYQYDFDMENKIHKGILLSLIIYSKNNPMTPFYPLPEHGCRYKVVLSYYAEWSQTLYEVLERSKIF